MRRLTLAGVLWFALAVVLTLLWLIGGIVLGPLDDQARAATPAPDPVVSTAAVRTTAARANVWLWRAEHGRQPTASCYPPAGGWWNPSGGRCAVSILIPGQHRHLRIWTLLVRVRITRPACTPSRNTLTGGFRFPVRARDLCLRATESDGA